MSFFRHHNSYCWNCTIPAAIRHRVGVGKTFQKKLTTRQASLAKSLAEYLTGTAPLLFSVLHNHPELSAREVRGLLQNLARLSDTVELRDGVRERGRYLEEDIRIALGMKLRDDKNGPTDRALSAFGQQLHELTRKFDYLSGKAGRSRNGSKRLSEVVLLFLEECKASFTRQTYFNRQTHLRALLEIVGDKPVREVSRQDLRDFKEAMIRLPAFWEQRYPGVPIREILEKPPIHRPLKAFTVNNYLSVVGTFFEWALINGYVFQNPARRLKIKLKQIPSMERDRLSADDLKLIFEKSPTYSTKSSSAALIERKRDIETYHLFWLPLISLYSGMRVGEIIGLQGRDIVRIGNVWCFKIRANALRNLKTVGAERTVPVHPALIRFGLLRAIKSNCISPRDPLWPRRALPTKNRRMTSFSTYWSAYRKQAGVDQPGKTFHSFRHTFIDTLVNLEARPEVVCDITGHTIKGQVYGRYRKRASPERLLRAMKRVRFSFSANHLIESGSSRAPPNVG